MGGVEVLLPVGQGEESLGAIQYGGQLRVSVSGGGLGVADRPVGDATLDGVRPPVGEVGGPLGGGDVTGDEEEVGPIGEEVDGGEGFFH